MKRSAIIVVVDRLGAGFLGPYGNTWLETPTLNRLASQSLLGEFLIADSPDLATLYQSYWLSPLSESLGPRATLLTNEPRVAQHPLAERLFAEVIVEQPVPPAAPAVDLSQTQTAQLIAAAIEWLEQATAPFVLWLHVRAMEGPWDAPQSLRDQFADEGDPLPSNTVEPPNRELPRGFDPDDVLPLLHAYAGQVVALDQCLEPLLAASAEHPAARETLWLFTSPRGFPLGEHRRLGACDEALYGELLQTPLLVRYPNGLAAAQRAQSLLKPADIAAAIADWIQPKCEASAESSPLLAVQRDRIVIRSDREQALRTPAWFLRLPQDGEPELFRKPDDRWEANEVARRCGDVVEQLQAALTAPDSQPLPRELVEGWD